MYRIETYFPFNVLDSMKVLAKDLNKAYKENDKAFTCKADIEVSSVGKIGVMVIQGQHEKGVVEALSITMWKIDYMHALLGNKKV